MGTGKTKSVVKPSACPLDCPDACSLTVELTGGETLKLDGSSSNPVTAGFICSKVRHFDRHVHGDERIRRPALRVGPKGSGDFREASWEEALELVSGRLREVRERSGGEAILPHSYGGSNGLLTQDNLDARLFRRLGSSRLLRTICAAPSTSAATGLYGKMAGVSIEDYEQADLIVVWGANPSSSGIHLVPRIHRAQARGAKLVVVDPRRTQLARKADLHIAPRPGTDLPIALSMIRWFFESERADLAFLGEHADGVEELRERARPWSFEHAARVAGVEIAELVDFTNLYLLGSPALIRCGWGVERNRNGGSAIAAILALPAVAGKFRQRGGGYTMSNSGAWRFDPEAVIGEPEPHTREINMNRLGTALTELSDPPIELLFVYNSNPLATSPNQELVRRGLAREDLFTVVFDQVHTDTARYADVLLPATTFLEHEELVSGYGALMVQHSRPAIEPVGEARANAEVFLDLLDRLELRRPGEVEGIAELAATYLEQGRSGGWLDDFDPEGGLRPAFGDRPIQFVDVFPGTQGGKIRLVPEELDRESPAGLYGYRENPAHDRHPLSLISPATSRTISSTLGQLHREGVPIEIHPMDAGARNIGDGDPVRVFNDLGQVLCRARHNQDMRPGVLCLPKGLWSHNTDNGCTSNALSPDTLTDLGGGACFNDARVQIELAPPPARGES